MFYFYLLHFLIIVKGLGRKNKNILWKIVFLPPDLSTFPVPSAFNGLYAIISWIFLSVCSQSSSGKYFCRWWNEALECWDRIRAILMLTYNFFFPVMHLFSCSDKFLANLGENIKPMVEANDLLWKDWKWIFSISLVIFVFHSRSLQQSSLYIISNVRFGRQCFLYRISTLKYENHRSGH